MATQRLLLLKVVGVSGKWIADRCRQWEQLQKTTPDDSALLGEIGRLAETLDAHRAELPVVHYVEWVDRWSMLDTFAKPFVDGRGTVHRARGRFDLVCCTDEPAKMLNLPLDGWQFDEQAWLAAHLHEVTRAWDLLIGNSVLVLLRQTIGTSATDEEIQAAQEMTSCWLSD